MAPLFGTSAIIDGREDPDIVNIGATLAPLYSQVVRLYDFRVICFWRLKMIIL
jgi:hypothetical protein